MSNYTNFLVKEVNSYIDVNPTMDTAKTRESVMIINNRIKQLEESKKVIADTANIVPNMGNKLKLHLDEVDRQIGELSKMLNSLNEKLGESDKITDSNKNNTINLINRKQNAEEKLGRVRIKYIELMESKVDGNNMAGNIEEKLEMCKNTISSLNNLIDSLDLQIQQSKYMNVKRDKLVQDYEELFSKIKTDLCNASEEDYNGYVTLLNNIKGYVYPSRMNVFKER